MLALKHSELISQADIDANQSIEPQITQYQV